MRSLSHPLAALATGAALMLGAGGAHASLVLSGAENFSGTGLGNVNTVLTIQSPGSSTFEQGSVAFGNVTTGNVLTGASQTQTRTLGSLGITSAADLRVVFNAVEPGGAQSGITLQDLVLTVYSPTGTALFTSGAFTPITFPDTFNGAGNSGFVFKLEGSDLAAASAAFGAGSAGNLVGLSAAAGCAAGAAAGCQAATGGFETFFVANAATVAPVPEASTAAMMLLGLGAVGAVVRRRKNR